MRVSGIIMTGHDKKESCEKKKVIEEEPTDIVCECSRTVHLGEICTCGITHDTVVKDKDECEDSWTEYERGKSKRKK